jgi:hypothetical protein
VTNLARGEETVECYHLGHSITCNIQYLIYRKLSHTSRATFAS